MGLFSFWDNLFSSDQTGIDRLGMSSDFSNSLDNNSSGLSLSKSSESVINPTTGLPMVGDSPGGFDVGGYYWCETPDHFNSLDSGSGLDFDSGSGFGSSFGSSMDDW